MVDKEFTYVHDTALFFTCSPNGVASMLFQMKSSSITGVGGTYSPLSAAIQNGLLYYNDKTDLVTPGEEEEGTIFKMVIYNEPTDNSLRIDFHKLRPGPNDDNEKWKTMFDFDSIVNPNEDIGDLLYKYNDFLKHSSNIPDLVFIGELPSDSPKDLETCDGICIFRDIEYNL